MADINNKLRLKICTELDAAGIKATQEQIDKLAKSTEAAGSKSKKISQLENAFGNLPGPLGKISKSVGGLTSQVGMVIGAFTLGCQIGEKIVEVGRQWKIFPDVLGDIKKEQEAANREMERNIEVTKEAFEAQQKFYEEQTRSADRMTAKIDAQTDAYFRQVSAVNGLRKAGNNAALAQLERAKYEEMRDYSYYSPEAAEQVGKYYDVLIAEEQAKQQIVAFDKESEALAAKRQAQEEQAARAAEQVAEAKEREKNATDKLGAYAAKYGRWMENGKAYYGVQYEDEAAEVEAAVKELENAKKAREAAESKLEKRMAGLDTVNVESATRAMERANLVESANFNVLKAADAYDDFVSANGNAANATIEEGWGADLLRSSQESITVQHDMLKEVRAMVEKFDRLLEVK